MKLRGFTIYPARERVDTFRVANMGELTTRTSRTLAALGRYGREGTLCAAGAVVVMRRCHRDSAHRSIILHRRCRPL
jgi:hypothetical protein